MEERPTELLKENQRHEFPEIDWKIQDQDSESEELWEVIWGPTSGTQE